MTDQRIQTSIDIAGVYVRHALIIHGLNPNEKTLDFSYSSEAGGVKITDEILKHIFEMLRSCKEDITTLDFSHNEIQLDKLQMSISFSDTSFYSCFYKNKFLQRIKTYDFTGNPLVEQSQNYLMEFLTSVNMPDRSEIKVKFDHALQLPFQYKVRFMSDLHSRPPETQVLNLHTQPYMIRDSFKSLTGGADG